MVLEMQTGGVVLVKTRGHEVPFLPRILPHGEGLFRHTNQIMKIFGSGRILHPEAVRRWLARHLFNLRSKCRTCSAARPKGQ
jgi:hypothetical protein